MKELPDAAKKNRHFDKRTAFRIEVINRQAMMDDVYR
jgi:hypothetical protein